MKKIIAQIIALIAINASAYDVTNTVTVVSNIYNRISEEHWITNNIKNTHTNCHYTNNVYTVSNVTLLVSQQTFKTNTTVNLDVSQQAIADARAQANRASEFAANALGYASSAAEQAGNAQEHSLSAQNFRDEAEYYANQAHAQVQPIIDEGARQIAAVQAAGNTQTGRVTSEGNYQVGRVSSAGSSNVGSVNSAGQTALNNINEKQQWFEQHFGQMVTNVNNYTTDRIYDSSHGITYYSYRCTNGSYEYKIRINPNEYIDSNYNYQYTDILCEPTLDTGDSITVYHYKRTGDFEITLRKSAFGMNIVFGRWTYSADNPIVLPTSDSDTYGGGRSYYLELKTYRGYIKGDKGIYNGLDELVDDLATTNGVNNAVNNAIDNLPAVARTGSYNDLIDKPISPTFATVAFTGSYNDLTNKPDFNEAASTQLVHYTSIDSKYPAGWFYYEIYRNKDNHYVGYIRLRKQSLTDYNGRPAVYVELSCPGYHAMNEQGGTCSAYWQGNTFRLSFPPNGSGSWLGWSVSVSQRKDDFDIPRFDLGNAAIEGFYHTAKYAISFDDDRKYADSFVLGNLDAYSVPDRTGQPIKIGRLILNSELNNLSNWVERVFQKK